MPRREDLCIGGSNLTATKARLLLMLCIMKFGMLPVALDPLRPTGDEIAATAGRNRQFQAIFDSHYVKSARLLTRPLPTADIQRHQRVDLRRLHHLVDVDLLVAGADAPAARTDLDRRDAELVVDVGVGPDAGAVRTFRFDLLAEQVLKHLFRRLHQRRDVLALMTEQRLVDVHLVIDPELVERLLHFALDRSGRTCGGMRTST